MNTDTYHSPLSNIQIELLKLFSKDLPEEELIELKKHIAGFLLAKGRERANAIWIEKGYGEHTLKQLLNED